MRCGTCQFDPCRCEDLRCEFKPLSDGRRVHVAGVTGQAGWPRESDALGVLPDQCREAYEASVALGVPTQYNLENGCAILENQQHQNKLLKAQGRHHRNSFNT